MSTTTQATTPTVAQYEIFVSSLVERFTPAQLFKHQVECYANAGIATVEELEPLRVHLPEDGKLFLMVPPKPQIATKAELDALISKLAYKGRRGINYLNQYLVDEVIVPKGVYLMTGVDDGRAMLNVAPRDARIRLADAHRLPFVWWEGYGLCLCFGFAIFRDHNVDCSGSRYDSGYVPHFYLRGGEPRFYSHWGGSAYPRWGSASCGSRIGA